MKGHKMNEYLVLFRNKQGLVELQVIAANTREAIITVVKSEYAGEVVQVNLADLAADCLYS